MDQDDHRRFSVAGPEVIAKGFGEEVVVANLNSGIFYSLRESAITIWSNIEKGRSLAEIIAAFSGSEKFCYETITSCVQQFIDHLIGEALIIPSGREDPTIDPQVETMPFTMPIIERFDDLQGLLLVDPIHDVTELGWPMVSQKIAS